MGRYRQASTEDPPDSDKEEHCVDLNLPPAIIDLTEPLCPPARIHKMKSKRQAFSTTQSERSSKHSSKGDAIFDEISNEFYEMRKTFDRLKTSATLSSVGDAGSSCHPVASMFMNAAMDVINVLADELSILVDPHSKACKAVVNPNLAKIVLKKTDVVQCHWLMYFVHSGDD